MFTLVTCIEIVLQTSARFVLRVEVEKRDRNLMTLEPFGENEHEARFADSSFSSHGENHARGRGGGRDDRRWIGILPLGCCSSVGMDIWLLLLLITLKPQRFVWVVFKPKFFRPRFQRSVFQFLNRPCNAFQCLLRPSSALVVLCVLVSTCKSFHVLRSRCCSRGRERRLRF